MRFTRARHPGYILMSVNQSPIFIDGGSNTFSYFKGRVALYALLESMGVGRGDEVIMPAFTCVVVPNAVTYLGATPVYVDISEGTYNIDTNLLESSITPRTKAIIAQHTFGIPAEMDEILNIANKYDLYVIEDSCHAVGSRYKGVEVGTIGDASFFSSQWSKPITTGLGGWACVNNPELASRMKEGYTAYTEPSGAQILLLRLQYQMFTLMLKPGAYWTLQSIYRKLSELGIAIGSSSTEELNYKMPRDYKMKMSSWQMKLLSDKLKSIVHLVEHRKKIVTMYEKLLKQKGLTTVGLPSYMDTVYLRYPVLVEYKQRVLEEAKRKRVEIGDWFLSPVHPNLSGWEKVNYVRGSCPIAESVCSRVINLPTHSGVTLKEARGAVEIIESVS